MQDVYYTHNVHVLSPNYVYKTDKKNKKKKKKNRFTSSHNTNKVYELLDHHNVCKIRVIAIRVIADYIHNALAMCVYITIRLHMEISQCLPNTT